MRLLSSLLAALLSAFLFAQAPNAFDFQGVARDASGNVLAVQGIGLRISVHSGTAIGPVEYQETHAVTTNAFGLFSIAVGNGTVAQGSFANVAWGAAPHFLQVEMDASGGSSYSDMGTTQLLSVPYALHAGSVACPTVSLLGDTLRQGNGCFVIIPGISAANGGCLDTDGDGFYHIAGCGPVDCDDSNAQVHPGGVELCGNGLDDDCDGGSDNSTNPQDFVDWHPDSDGDGYGDPAISISACSQPAGHVLDDNDCDDTNPAIFPGQGCSLFCTPADIAWVDQNQEAYLQLAASVWVNCVINGNTSTACVVSALVNTGATPLSASCHECVAQRFACIVQNCLTQCLSQGPICDACIESAGCHANFIQCMGLVDADGDGWVSGSDCDDNNSAVHPDAQEVCNGIDDNCDGLIDDEDPFSAGSFPFLQDLDGDGFGNPAVTIYKCTPGPYTDLVPDDGTIADCNDNDPTIFPGAQEICDEWDNDCDGEFNEADAVGAVSWYFDQDGDGYGADDNVVIACEPPSGYVQQGGDCDDFDPSLSPGSLEDCFDGIDNDCDGIVDEVQNIWYQDLDNDDYGNEAVFEVACTPSPGYIQTGGDCDDNDPNVRPNVAEICGNGIDDDCDGQVDENAVIRYRDADGDGYGNPLETLMACTLPAGYVNNSFDCDDSNADVNPTMAEICDGIDNDCNGFVDDGLCNIDGNCYAFGESLPGTPCLICDPFTSLTEWTPAPQGTACGSNGCSFSACDGAGSCVTTFFAQGTPCDDGNPNTIDDVCDGAGNCAGTLVEPELCNGVDDDGDGLVDAADPNLVLVPCELQQGVCNGSMKSAERCQGGIWLTCATSDYLIGSPVFQSPETSCDGVDNDCDGVSDEGCGSDCGPGIGACGPGFICVNGFCVQCIDNDADGVTTCDGDCDDNDPEVFPGALEICGDGLDNDCDGTVDNSSLWFEDQDNDGFGNPGVTLQACEQPSGYVAVAGDCDDLNAAVFPLAGPGSGCSSCSITDRQWMDDNYLELWNTTGIAVSECQGLTGQAAWDCLRSHIVPFTPIASTCIQCAVERAFAVVNNCQADCVPWLLSDGVSAGSEACSLCTIGNAVHLAFAGCSGVVDMDGDGVPASADCNDNDASIRPGAVEVCDGADNNCNGQMDEGGVCDE